MTLKWAAQWAIFLFELRCATAHGQPSGNLRSEGKTAIILGFDQQIIIFFSHRQKTPARRNMWSSKDQHLMWTEFPISMSSVLICVIRGSGCKTMTAFSVPLLPHSHEIIFNGFHRGWPRSELGVQLTGKVVLSPADQCGLPKIPHNFVLYPLGRSRSWQVTDSNRYDV